MLGRLVWILFLLAPLGCTVALEPSYDAKIVSELEALVAETESLFVGIDDGIPPNGFAARNDTYAALAARAATIKLYAEARPAPSGRLTGFFSNLFSPPTPSSLEEIGGGDELDRTSALADAESYANATAGFMEDYLRNLKKLADRDRENVQAVVGSLDGYEAAQSAFLSELEKYQQAYGDWIAGRGPKPGELRAAPTAPTGSVSANFVQRRRVVIEDILRDALFYERDILNRNR